MLKKKKKNWTQLDPRGHVVPLNLAYEERTGDILWYHLACSGTFCPQTMDIFQA